MRGMLDHPAPRKPGGRILCPSTMAILIGLSASAQNLVQNGSFERPAVPPGGNLISARIPEGWSSLSDGSSTDIIHESYRGSSAAEGVQFLDLIPGLPSPKFPSGLAQTIRLESGTEYRLSFSYNGARYDDGGSTTNAVLNWSMGDLLSGNINVDGLNVYSKNGPVTPWQVFSTNFVATTSGDYELRFQTSWGWFGSPYVDNVWVTEAGPPCGTQVGGNVFGQVWTKDGSPYCVTNDVFVTDLTIRAGVEVRFEPGFEFEVAGVLRVRGTADEPVRFKPADAAAGWRGMLFRNAQPGSSLTHTIIEGSVNSGLRITNTPPAMTNCFIINNRALGEGGGILADMRDVDFILVDCVVSNNLAGGWGGGARLRAVNSTVTLMRCTFAENGSVARTSAEQYGGGLLAGLSDTHARIEGCDFARNWVEQHGSALGGTVFSFGAVLVECSEGDVGVVLAALL